MGTLYAVGSSDPEQPRPMGKQVHVGTYEWRMSNSMVFVMTRDDPSTPNKNLHPPPPPVQVEDP
jgi:hypothetical protein